MESGKKAQQCGSHKSLWVALGFLAILLCLSTGLTAFTLLRFSALQSEVFTLKTFSNDGMTASPDKSLDSQVSTSEEHYRVRRDATADKLLADLPIESLWNAGGIPGKNGRDGRDGKDGVDGINGRDGRDGRNGIDGQNCNCSTTANSQRAGSDVERVGSTYIRWGRTSCGANSSILYQGFTAGQHYSQTGGSTEYTCLPIHPQYNQWTRGRSAGTYIYGAEFETKSYGIFPSEAQDKNVPCAQCYSSRSTTLMIPARRACPDSWNKEYEGYLMTGGSGDAHPYNYVCVDANPEYVAGTESNTNGATMFFVAAYCGSTFHCPPYINHAEISCVVCTK